MRWQRSITKFCDAISAVIFFWAWTTRYGPVIAGRRHRRALPILREFDGRPADGIHPPPKSGLAISRLPGGSPVRVCSPCRSLSRARCFPAGIRSTANPSDVDCFVAVLTSNPNARESGFVAFERGQRATGAKRHVGQRGHAIDQIPRHARVQIRAPDQHAKAACKIGQEDHGLSRLIPSANQDDVLPPHQARLDGGGPVIRPASFEPVETRHLGLAIGRPARRDDRARPHLLFVGQRKQEAFAVALDTADLAGNRQMRAELERLLKRARR
jgi:hypothetical protein